jgi:hypothetical protein
MKEVGAMPGKIGQLPIDDFFITEPLLEVKGVFDDLHHHVAREMSERCTGDFHKLVNISP